jgi:hypothetical protein
MENMTISDPFIVVTCNKCNLEEEFNQTLLHEIDWYEHLMEILNSKGWTKDNWGRDFCPFCTIQILTNNADIKIISER